jgi:predicted O-methyltransferase YrrM
MGRAQVLAATHFPRIFAALGGLTAPMMVRPGRPERSDGNLESPAVDGHRRSTRQQGRRFSAYAARPRSALAIIGLTVAAGLSAAWIASRSRGKA